MKRRGFWYRTTIVFVILAMTLAACGGDDDDDSSDLPTEIGDGEGALNLVAWEGYVESGGTDPAVNWVGPFEEQTGCKVNVKYAGTSDEMFTLLSQSGDQYDGVSASGDSSNRLIAAGAVSEVNVDLLPNYKDISPALQSPPHNTIDGKHYGISFMWGANVLMYNTDVVTTAPDSWAQVFDGTSYAGKVTAYDSPIYIADAALYLKATKPELKITDPYELTQEQFDASVALLQEQHKQIGKYWGLATDEIDIFTSGDAVIGTAWPYQYLYLKANDVPVEAVLPKEGATGWADTWMMSSKAKHPNCMYKWMDYMASPEVQKQVAEYLSYSPANAKTCDLLGQQFCDDYHVTDTAYFNSISFWKTPIADCGNGQKNCIDYAKWTEAWLQIKG